MLRNNEEGTLKLRPWGGILLMVVDEISEACCAEPTCLPTELRRTNRKVASTDI